MFVTNHCTRFWWTMKFRVLRQAKLFFNCDLFREISHWCSDRDIVSLNRKKSLYVILRIFALLRSFNLSRPIRERHFRMWMPEVFDFRFSRKSDRAVVQFCLKCNCQIVLEIKSQIAKNFENMSGCRIPFTYKNVLTSCVQTRELRQTIFYGKLNIPLKTRSSELTTVFLSSC